MRAARRRGRSHDAIGAAMAGGATRSRHGSLGQRHGLRRRQRCRVDGVARAARTLSARCRPSVVRADRRRRLVGFALIGVLTPLASPLRARQRTNEGPKERLNQHPNERTSDDDRFIDAAFAMKAQAESLGDQPYGAVLVLDGRIVGEGPSRVIQRSDPDAHAEREAIRDARARLGRDRLDGSVLYSTSRPCSLCERAAAAAGVARMIHGRPPVDAGRPRSAA